MKYTKRLRWEVTLTFCECTKYYLPLFHPLFSERVLPIPSFIWFLPCNSSWRSTVGTVGVVWEIEVQIIHAVNSILASYCLAWCFTCFFELMQVVKASKSPPKSSCSLTYTSSEILCHHFEDLPVTSNKWVFNKYIFSHCLFFIWSSSCIFSGDQRQCAHKVTLATCPEETKKWVVRDCEITAQ